MFNETEITEKSSIQRALRVLSLIVEEDCLTLETTHLLTGLPKATLVRIFNQLELGNWVHRYLGDKTYVYLPHGRYELNKIQQERRIAHAVKPLLQSLFQETQHPSDFAYYFENKLKIVESSFGLTNARKASRRVIGLEPDIKCSALGKAYTVGKSGNHKKGQYASRSPNFWEYDDVPQLFTLNAIAVPIYNNDGKCVGSLNLVWHDNDTTPSEMAHKYLINLEKIALKIGELTVL